MKRSPKAVLSPDPQRSRVTHTSTSGSTVCFLMFTMWCVLSPLGAAESYTLDLWWVSKLMFLFFGHTFQKMYTRKTVFLIFLVHHYNTLFSSQDFEFQMDEVYICINRKTSAAACNFNTLSKVEFSGNS